MEFTLENPKINYYELYKMMGLQIIEDKSMVNKFRNKIHNKKRIDKKYLKKFGFLETPKKEVFKFGFTVIGHPETIKALNRLQ